MLKISLFHVFPQSPGSPGKRKVRCLYVFHFNIKTIGCHENLGKRSVGIYFPPNPDSFHRPVETKNSFHQNLLVSTKIC